jgi:hypothetical protein
MVDIQQVYEILRDLCNKDQRGFVTQNEFNNFASAAQTKIYNEIFREVIQGNKLRRQQVDGKGPTSMVRQKQEDLAYYFAEFDLLGVDEALDPTYYATQENQDGALVQLNEATQMRWIKPRDLRYVIGIHLGELDSAGQSATPCEIIRDPQKYRRVLNSRLSHPSVDFPIAFIGDATINIHPNVAGLRPVMTYYRQARSRYTLPQLISIGDVEVADVAVDAGAVDIGSQPIIVSQNNANGISVVFHENTRNFDLPEHYMPEVIMEMAHMIGVNVRDNVLMQYGLKLSTEQ